MDKMKQTVALTLLGTLALLAVSWFLLIGPKRGEAAALREQTATQVSATSALLTQLQVLKAQAKELPRQQAQLAAVAAKVPADPALPSLVRALIDASARSGVHLVSITPGTPAAVSAASPSVAVDPAAPTAPAAPPAPAASAAGTLAGIPVSLSVAGDFFEVEQFLAALEELPRALKVSELTMAPGTPAAAGGSSGGAQDGRHLSATIKGTVYMAAAAPLPATPVAPAAPVAAPAAPVAAGAPAAVTVPTAK